MTFSSIEDCGPEPERSDRGRSLLPIGRHEFLQQRDQLICFFPSGFPAERDPDGALRFLIAEAHLHQNPARLDPSGVTGRPRGDCDPLQVEADHDRFGITTLQQKVRRVGKSICSAPVDRRVRNLREQPRFHLVPDGSHLPAVIRFLQRQLGSDPQSHGERDRFGPCPAPELLAATENERMKRHSFTDDQRTTSFRTMKLVSRQCEGVDAEIPERDRDLSHRLYRIRMNQDAPFPADPRNLRHRLQHSGLVVGQHHRDHRGLRLECVDHPLRRDPAVLIRRNEGHPMTTPLQIAKRTGNRRMFDRGGYDMATLVPGENQPMQDGIVGFSAPTREDYLFRLRVDESREVFPRLLQRPAREASLMMDARGIPEDSPLIGDQGVQDPWVHPGRRIVVEVDSHTAPDRRATKGPGMKKAVSLALLIFSSVALNAAAQSSNPAPPPKPPTATSQKHPTRNQGVRKLSRHERKERLKNLADKYHDFLNEVEPIMLPEELNTFLLLESDAQRDLYIEKFWEIRDPDTHTARNEYRDRYKELLVEAKEKFRYLTSDRARVYLVRGRPVDILKVEHCEQYLQPIEIWVYDQKLAHTTGNPLLIFYQPRVGGIDWRLWIPIAGDVAESLKQLLSVQGERNNPYAVLQNDLIGVQCENMDVLRRAVAWTDINRFELANVFEPPQVETEDVGKMLRTAVIRDPQAPQLPVEFSSRYPGKRGSRTSLEMTVTVDRSQLGTRELNDQKFYNLDVNGEILKDGQIFDTYRYQFDFPADKSPQQLPLVVERFLRPAKYTSRMKITDVNSGAEAIVEKDLDVPYVAESEEVKEAAREGSATIARLQEEYRKGETTLRIVPMPDDILTGLQHVETLLTGNDVASVEFYLDGTRIMTKRQPPYELDLDLGSVPMNHSIRVVGRNEGGEVITGDEAVINVGSDPFRVHIVSPRVTGKVSGNVRMETEVKVPEGKKLQSLDLYLNETKLATLYEPPFVQTIQVPSDLEVGYLRAVATLDDSRKSQAEDLVFLNTPEFLQQVDVHLVELPTTVLRHGRPVDDLPQSAFSVLDEGAPVKIAKFEYVRDLPLSIGVAIDSSGSMQLRMLEAQKAGAQFFSHVLRPGDKGFVVAFDEQPRVVQKWTNDLAALTAGLASLRAEESTALYDAVIYSLYNFQGIKGQKALILVSDGKDTASRFEFEQAAEYARRSAVPIYAIGIGIRATEADVKYKLSKLARDTGGNAFYIRDIRDLEDIYDQIELELRAQYLLGFYPPSDVEPGDKWREVRVRVDGAEAKTISGYYP